MKDELKNYINNIHRMPNELLDEFIAPWNLKHSSRKEIITSAGTIERYLYFTTKGFQKAYYIKKDREYNIAFTYPFNLTCIPESFLTREPSRYYFECLTDSEFLCISYDDFIYLVEEYHDIETMLRKALVRALGGMVNRYHRILTLTMEERFRDFMQTNPHLINQIPRKEIANYLKIDPTNFSKLLTSIKI